MKNYAKLIEKLASTENSFRAVNSQLLTVWSELESEISLLKKSQSTDIQYLKVEVCKVAKISENTFDKRISMIKSAIKKGLKPSKYSSFNALEKAKGNVASGNFRATKVGTVVADKKGQAKNEEKKVTIQATNENEILQLLQLESFRKFKIDFEKAGFSLANVMKALKTEK